VLTLDDALALAKRANKNIIAERARLAQAQTNIDQAWAVLLPTITAQGKYTRNYKEVSLPFGGTGNLLIQPLNQLDGQVGFTAPLLVIAAYPGLKSVKQGVASQEANFEATEDQVLLSVAQAFYAAAATDEVLISRHSNIEVARATLQNAQTRFSAGTVTKVDVDRAELALVRADQLEREALYAHEQTYRALGTLIQLDGPFTLKLPTATEPLPATDTSQGNLDLVLHLRPEFRALEMAVLSAESSVRTDAWRWAPSLSAFGNARKFNYENFGQNRYSWAVGAQLDWVIYDGGQRDALRHQSAAQADEARARGEALRDSIRDDLANGRTFLETKQRALDASTRSVTLAQETLDLVRTQYEAGTVTQVDLLQAQDNLVVSQEALAQAHFDVAVADISLRHTAGTFPPK
jgi:outer membrane protein TolC